jgi:SAM-dependent methyltransferase
VSDGFQDHFSERAAGYAAYRPHYPPELTQYLATLVPPNAGVWEAGCGSGQLSTILGDRFGRVIATDASREQIARAHPHPRVEYRAEPAERTSIGDATVDLIVAAQAAHWFDLPRFYGEARRVGRPAAVIVLVSYAKTAIDDDVDDTIEAFYSGPLGKWWPLERIHPETGYSRLEFPFDETPPPQIDMEASWTADDLLGYVSTWSAVRAMESAEGGAATERFSEKLRAAWGTGVRRVTWPISMRVGRVHPARAD